MCAAISPLLAKILSQPTAPFQERHVKSVLLEEFQKHGVPHFEDPAGNLVVGVATQEEYQKLVQTPSSDPIPVFMAHMDHPGFHGIRWKSDRQLEIQWHGGAPVQHLQNAPVWLADQDKWRAEGRLIEARLHTSGRTIDTGLVELTAPSAQKPDAASILGGFRFRTQYWEENEILYTKAADDLVGTFTIAELAIDHFSPSHSSSHAPSPFLGILTRAEEVGFIGALAHLELGWLQATQRPILCISLETSRTLPGAEIGKGPIVRLGDLFTVFSAPALRILTDLAQSTLPNAYQRRIMDGGTCEATAATVYGLPSIGIAIPLGNYHNQGFEGGPDCLGPQGPAPEFVHLKDLDGMRKLCRALLSQNIPWNTPWESKKAELKNRLDQYRPLLKQGR